METYSPLLLNFSQMKFFEEIDTHVELKTWNLRLIRLQICQQGHQEQFFCSFRHFPLSLTAIKFYHTLKNFP